MFWVHTCAFQVVSPVPLKAGSIEHGAFQAQGHDCALPGSGESGLLFQKTSFPGNSQLWMHSGSSALGALVWTRSIHFTSCSLSPLWTGAKIFQLCLRKSARYFRETQETAAFLGTSSTVSNRTVSSQVPWYCHRHKALTRSRPGAAITCICRQGRIVPCVKGGALVFSHCSETQSTWMQCGKPSAGAGFSREPTPLKSEVFMISSVICKPFPALAVPEGLTQSRVRLDCVCLVTHRCQFRGQNAIAKPRLCWLTCVCFPVHGYML